MTKLRQWELDALGVRQTKRITIVNAEHYDPGFPPAPLAEFQEWLEDIVAQIPTEFRDTATVEFDSTGSYYDSHYVEVEVQYRRPETDEEWEARKADVMARYELVKAERESAERAAYKALKAKFEADAP